MVRFIFTLEFPAAYRGEPSRRDVPRHCWLADLNPPAFFPQRPAVISAWAASISNPRRDCKAARQSVRRGLLFCY